MGPDMSAAGTSAAVMEPIPLTQLPVGRYAALHESRLDPEDGALLRAMGLRPDCRLKMCRAGSACIVAVEGACGSSCRIGMARGLAERVYVRVLA